MRDGTIIVGALLTRGCVEVRDVVDAPSVAVHWADPGTNR